mgnify:CR=1 FL=1
MNKIDSEIKNVKQRLSEFSYKKKLIELFIDEAVESSVPDIILLLLNLQTNTVNEEVLVNYINNSASENEKFIIAPHNIKKEAIEKLKNSILKKVVLFSEKEEKKELKNYQVIIVDTIGILTKIYSYADIAYVGGGFTKSGVHNVLEPATFGVPIIIGPNYNKFIEAKELVNKQACFVADNSQKLSVLLTGFFSENKKRLEAGSLSLNYVIEKTGASEKILNYIK